MRLNSRFVAAIVAVVVLAGLGLGVAVPALGARDNDARLKVVLSCEISEKGADVAIDVSALLRERTVAVSLVLRDKDGDTPIMADVEGQPDLAGLFRDTAEGETAVGWHLIIVAIDAGGNSVHQLQSAVELTPSACVAGNRLFVGELTWIEPEFDGGGE
jgi:hypothetical protein